MADLVPTMATALVYENGLIIGSNGGDWTLNGEREKVPCLILPAPRPIEECPSEWKDGRRVWLYCPLHGTWEPGRHIESGWYPYVPTHIMLPPPSPEEAPR